MANVVVSALATWNGKALKKAKQDVSVFDKQLKNFAKSVGLAFSATKIISFSKKAVKAFAEDEVAAKSLALQLENTGNAFRVSEVESYIKSLEKTNAILTDLRAPFQTLLNVTGSVELAQRSLEAALDISAGTGQSLSTVISAISAGARGQTKAIRGLNTGIDENILASGDMNKIMEELERRFSGQAAARLSTYTGKMDALKKSADEASKIIGEGLVDALVILSEDNTVENLSNDMEDFATAIADTIRGVAKLTKKIQEIPGLDKFLTLEGIPVVGSYLKAFRNYGAQSRPASTNMGGYSGIPDLKVARELLKVTKDNVKFRKQENDQLKKKTAVDQLKDKFDLERIGLMAALSAATDYETKLRILSQIAILDNNEAMAKKLLAELNGVKAADELTEALYGVAGAAMDSAAKFAQINPFAGTYYGETGRDQPSTSTLSNVPSRLPPRDPLAGTYYGETGRDMPSNLRITVDTTATGDRFSQLIAESLQVASRSGYSSVPNGGLPV
jgi:hypothetical protein